MVKIGLVFGGGGAKGSYEIGSWAALRDMGIEDHISAISGTSIGALNMALFSQGDLQTSLNLWHNITTNDIVTIKPDVIYKAFLMFLSIASHNEKGMIMMANELQKMTDWGSIGSYMLNKPLDRIKWRVKNGILSRHRLINLLSTYIDPDKIYTCERTLFACCYDIDNHSPKYFQLNDDISALATQLSFLNDCEVLKSPVLDILLASAAIPVVFDPIIINGNRYFDGGISDNLPIRPIYEYGCQEIIAINLDPDSAVDKSNYPNTSIYVIAPDKKLARKGIGEVLNFNKKTNEERIFSGYMDTFRCLSFTHLKFLNKGFNFNRTMVGLIINEPLRLNNGLEILVQKDVFLKEINCFKYVVFPISIQLYGGLIQENECFVLPNICYLAFPDGRRSFIDLTIESEHALSFPLVLKKGSWVNGTVSFRLSKSDNEFMLVVNDCYNHVAVGKTHCLSFSLRNA